MRAAVDAGEFDAELAHKGDGDAEVHIRIVDVGGYLPSCRKGARDQSRRDEEG